MRKWLIRAMLNHPASVRGVSPCMRNTCARLPGTCSALSPSTEQTYQDTIMDAERINLIGNTLSDLTVRTQELRRYL